MDLTVAQIQKAAKLLYDGDAPSNRATILVRYVDKSVRLRFMDGNGNFLSYMIAPDGSETYQPIGVE